MSPNEYCISIGILLHSFLQPLGQILLERRILNDGNAQRIVKAQHPFAWAFGDAFDLLNITDLEARILSVQLLNQQGHQNGPLGMGMYGTQGATLKSCKEQWCAGRRLEIQGLSDVLPCFGRILGCWPRKDEHVLRLDQFFLDP